MRTPIKICIFLSFVIIFEQRLLAQQTFNIEKYPINILNATTDTSKPFILYITGDGGWNKFSKNLCESFTLKGFPVVALNSAKYFWEKKSASQTSTDVTEIIRHFQKLWNKKNIILVGYSFGADVAPFVYNLFNKEVASNIVNINLLSPSAKTDFEIHVMVMLGGSGGGESVTNAINKINNKQLLLIFGEDESDFPIEELKIKNYTRIKLTGGHHYDGDEQTVCNTILKYLPVK